MSMVTCMDLSLSFLGMGVGVGGECNNPPPPPENNNKQKLHPKFANSPANPRLNNNPSYQMWQSTTPNVGISLNKFNFEFSIHVIAKAKQSPTVLAKRLQHKCNKFKTPPPSQQTHTIFNLHAVKAVSWPDHVLCSLIPIVLTMLDFRLLPSCCQRGCGKDRGARRWGDRETNLQHHNVTTRMILHEDRQLCEPFEWFINCWGQSLKTC